MENKICCICSQPLEDEFGNNPFGALDERGEPINWKDEDRCCNKCNLKYVIPGRFKIVENPKLQKIVKKQRGQL